MKDRWHQFYDFITNNLGNDGNDLCRFLSAESYSARRGIRVNPARSTAIAEIFDIFDTHGIGIGRQIPWEPFGYFHDCATLGSHFLHHAGVFYLQEPSAMLPASLLPLKEGGEYLDLCAAPGGKTTQLAGIARQKGIRVSLVANEIIASRHTVLMSNIERLGLLPDILTINSSPETLAKQLPVYFDGILVDAPCSGEGMFGRDPEALEQWNPEHAIRCAERQQAILRSAATMLRPGGYLVYSTCTVNSFENEGVIRKFLKEFPDFSLIPQQIFSGTRPGIDDIGLRVWPQDGYGEGQYCAVLQCHSNGTPSKTVSPTRRKKPTKNVVPSAELHLLSELLCHEWVENEAPFFAKNGDTLLWYPETWRSFPLLTRGITLGKVRGKHRINFLPSHTFAMLPLSPVQSHTTLLTEEETLRYIQGYPLRRTTPPVVGWSVACATPYAPLGWIKWHPNGEGKNHLPSGLYMRLPMNFTTSPG